jgi:hypothetical protein
LREIIDAVLSNVTLSKWFPYTCSFALVAQGLCPAIDEYPNIQISVIKVF